MHPLALYRNDFLNTATHAVGLALSIIGLPFLIIVASQRGGWYCIGSCTVFGLAMILMFATSTVYHASAPSKKGCVSRSLRKKFRLADHMAIYVMIAGSYTPYCLIVLRNNIGWLLFGVLWGMAFLGAIYKMFLLGKYPRLSLAIYILMGWLCVLAIQPLMESLPTISFVFLMAGGAFFMIGTWFFARERFRPAYHVVWHVFVLLGSGCLYGSVMGGLTHS